MPHFVRGLLLFIMLLSSISGFAQEDTLQFKELERDPLSLFLDDTFISLSANQSGIYMSNNFRALSYRPGFGVGLEQYIPLEGKMFLVGGITFQQRNFNHATATSSIGFSNYHLDIPFYTAWELPIYREFDLRLILGANIGIRLWSSVSGPYALGSAEREEREFQYNPSEFQRLDFGWTFGLSMEYEGFLFRFRGYSGFLKYDRREQGMMSSFSLDLGYFIFRKPFF